MEASRGDTAAGRSGLEALYAGAPAGRVAPERIVATVESYAALLSAEDFAGVAALFATDAVVRDPIVGPERRGREGIRAFFELGAAAVPDATVALDGEIRVCGDYAAAPLVAEATVDGSLVRLVTLDVMRFDEEGLIAAMDAYWGPHNLTDTPLGGQAR
jgi:steroid Delta-isomerase